MPAERHVVLQAIAARITPGMRVGIDGLSAAGKTTFADALEHPAVRVRLDDFHNAPEIRHARGEGPDTYDEDTDGFRRAVAETGRGVVPVADGIVIHKPELRGRWKRSVFLTGDRATLLERAIARDGLRERYETRSFSGRDDNTDPGHPRLVIDSEP